ncbi:carboxylesterase family protein, partial [Dactylonectria macrodidyma]
IATLASVAPCVLGALRASPQLPLLKLPYGIWRATKYDAAADAYTFRNIRYAAPPVGLLRFVPPKPPGHVEGVQNGSYGPHCLQAQADGRPPTTDSDEDCLFLDVYVSRRALNSQLSKAPVIVWIHGGSYTSGAKDSLMPLGLYDGTGLVYQSLGKAIVVSLNYRLGVLGGWIGGRTAAQAGATSLGLADQRAALQWIQKYIHLLGGNSSDVTIMGQSAGGGSIIHHITQKGGRRDPLFHKAIIQSAGWHDEWDQKVLDRAFIKFATAAGCPDGDLDCLRSALADGIMKAQAAYQGVNFGPVPDGKWIQRYASLELESGNYWKDLRSVVVTHVRHEGFGFAGTKEVSDKEITVTLQQIFRDKKTVAAIEKVYPPVNSSYSLYRNGLERLEAIIGDNVFVCNYRRVANAFAGQAYAAVWSRGNATHGADVTSTWYNPTLELAGVPLPDVMGDKVIAQSYQSYLVSFALNGDVNPLRNLSETVDWPLYPTSQTERLQALNIAQDGFKIQLDDQGKKSTCDFW